MSLPAHVLLVDDDPQVRDVLTKLLLRIVDEVTVVENGRTAVRSFTHQLPDLVLADVLMPGMSGCNLTQRIVDVDPEARVILMSGDERTLKEIEVLAMGTGAIGYLPKPFSLEVLKETLENAMEGEIRESEVTIPRGTRMGRKELLNRIIEVLPLLMYDVGHEVHVHIGQPPERCCQGTMATQANNVLTLVVRADGSGAPD